MREPLLVPHKDQILEVSLPNLDTTSARIKLYHHTNRCEDKHLTLDLQVWLDLVPVWLNSSQMQVFKCLVKLPRPQQAKQQSFKWCTMIRTRKKIPAYRSEVSVIYPHDTQLTQLKAKDNQNRRSVVESNEETDIKPPMILSCLFSVVDHLSKVLENSLVLDKVIMPSIQMSSRCKSSRIRFKPLSNKWKGESKSLSRFKMHRWEQARAMHLAAHKHHLKCLRQDT